MSPDEKIGLDVALFIQQNMANQHADTANLAQQLHRENIRLRAKIDAIREAVAETLAGPWMPTPNAVTMALYPSEQMIMRQIPAGHDIDMEER